MQVRDPDPADAVISNEIFDEIFDESSTAMRRRLRLGMVAIALRRASGKSAERWLVGEIPGLREANVAESGNIDDSDRDVHLVRPRRGRAIVFPLAIAAMAVVVAVTVGVGSESAAPDVFVVVEPNMPGTSSTPLASSSVTSAAGTATSSPAIQPGTSCCGEGRANVFVNARSAFDEWSSGGHWDFFNANYDLMLVYEPYWDSRLQHYDDVIVYDNVYAIYVGSDKAADHPEWILREADGSPVYIPWGCSDGCPQYAADISDPSYQQNFIDELTEVRDRGYPGLLLDDVNMLWRLGDENGDDAVPIDPNTGQPLTLASWQQYLADFLERIRAEFPDLQIGHNAIWYADSPSFDNPYVERQIAAADIIELERGATDSGLVAGNGKYGFQSFLGFIDRVHRLGGNVILLDESAQSPEEQWFNLAATLLVNDGGDLVSTEQWSVISPDGFWSGFDTDLGDALGPRYLADGLIRRDFTDGIVLLNEPDRSTVRVTLSEPMWLHDGTMVTEVELGEREAVVLYHSEPHVAARLFTTGAVVEKAAERIR